MNEVNKPLTPERGEGVHYKNIDILKGIGIILMVLGHSGFPFTHFIYLFHMAIFFIASGYCWNSKNSETISSVFQYTARKIKTLYVPYVLCNGAFLLLTNLFISLGIYTNDPHFLEVIGTDDPSCLTTVLSMKEFLAGFVNILTFYGVTELSGATWFLRVLFFVSVGHCIYEFLITKILKINRTIGTIALLLACCVVYEVNDLGIATIPSSVFTIPRTILLTYIVAYITYAIGIFIRQVSIGQRRTPWYMAILSIGILLICNQLGSISMQSAKITNVIFFILVSLCGWCAVMFVSEKIEPTKLARYISYLGKHTMPIICLHFLSFKIVTYLYLVLSKQDLVLLAYYPVLETETYLWIFYVIIGVLVPILLYMFYEKMFSLIRGKMIKRNFIPLSRS